MRTRTWLMLAVAAIFAFMGMMLVGISPSVSRGAGPATAQRPDVLAFASNCRPSWMYATGETCRYYRIYLSTDIDRPLTDGRGDTLDPAWSPDGQQIVFTFRPPQAEPAKTSFIEVMNADGTNRQRLTNLGSERLPVWSPDGRTLAFITDQGTAPGEIYLLNVASRTVRSLGSQGDVTSLDWSPDGRRLVYTSAKTLYQIDSDGQHRQRLTDGWDAVWSPDGRTLAFLRTDGVYLTRDVGQTSRKLDLHTWPVGLAGENYASPAWSADGTRLALTVYSVQLANAISTPVPPDRIGSQVVIVEIKTGISRLVTGGFTNVHPRWRPAIRSNF